MWRALIVLLLIANAAAFAAVRGTFGPAPAASEQQPERLAGQIQPQTLSVTPVGAPPAAPPVVVGGPDPSAAVHSVVLPQ